MYGLIDFDMYDHLCYVTTYIYYTQFKDCPKKEIHNYIINTCGLDFSRFLTFLFNFFC